MLEAEVELLVVAHAEKNGWLCRKLRWIGRVGAPDRVFMKDGQTVWVEFKRPGKGARATQVRELARMAEKGQKVHVIDNTQDGYELFD